VTGAIAFLPALGSNCKQAAFDICTSGSQCASCCSVQRQLCTPVRPATAAPLNAGEDLRHALDCALAGKPLERRVKNSIGCNIKVGGSGYAECSGMAAMQGVLLKVAGTALRAWQLGW